MEIVITDSWNSFLDSFTDNQKDIYYREEYVKLYETFEAKALCIVCMENENVLLMPYLRRSIEDVCDFETPYGYGGPICNTDDVLWIENALTMAGKHFAKNNYICGFVRFHPLMDNAFLCKGHFETIFDRNTVVIDTNMAEGEIWTKQITSKNRNMIRKAEKNNLIYKAEYDFSSIKDFIGLYNATMKRLSADDFYYFEEEYYRTFAEEFKGKAFLGTVRKEGKLICAALFMYSEKFGHYHLEGSDYNYSNLGANNYLLWKTACEFHNLGIEKFHLGGGYNSSEDNSLLKFKKAFSSDIADFYIGKWIFNEYRYKEIRKRWFDNNPEKSKQYGNMLLCYRY